MPAHALPTDAYVVLHYPDGRTRVMTVLVTDFVERKDWGDDYWPSTTAQGDRDRMERMRLKMDLRGDVLNRLEAPSLSAALECLMRDHTIDMLKATK